MKSEIKTDEIYTVGGIEKKGYADTRKTFGKTMKIFEKGNEMLILEPVGKDKVRIFYKCNIVS